MNQVKFKKIFCLLTLCAAMASFSQKTNCEIEFGIGFGSGGIGVGFGSSSWPYYNQYYNQCEPGIFYDTFGRTYRICYDSYNQPFRVYTRHYYGYPYGAYERYYRSYPSRRYQSRVIVRPSRAHRPGPRPVGGNKALDSKKPGMKK